MLKKPLLIIAIVLTSLPMNAQKEVEAVVQANLEAYNNRDLDVFMSHFTEDITMYSGMHGEVFAKGLEQVREVYGNLFKSSPDLNSTILKRIVLGQTVIDHEFIIGRMGSAEPLELILIYEVENGKIFRTTAIRK